MSDTTDLAQFGKIDQTGDPAHFMRFLDAACAEPSVQAYKRRLIEWLALRPGARVLDVGCGTGDDLRAMAQITGASGLAVGVDNSAAMIDEARRRAAGMAGVEFRLAEGTALPFADGNFDGSVADRSLMHVPDARRVLREMARVTRQGGRVAVFEVDFETAVIDVPERELARKVIRTWCDGFRDGWLGRRMPGMFVDLGLRDVEAVPYALRLPPALALPIMGKATTERAVRDGTVTPAEAQAWLAKLDELERGGRFFASLTGFLVAGTK